MQICLNSPLPSFDSIMASFRPLMTWPPKFPTFPKLPKLMFPSLPSPLFPSFHLPNFELMIHALELQALQLQTTIMGIIKPILDKLGMALDAFLPKIPGLPNLNLLDLLAGKAEKIIAAVKAAMEKGFRLPGWPFPLYVSMKIPDFEAIQTLQAIISNYMAMVAKLVPALIKKITDKFKLPGLPTIPKLPTIEEIMAMIASKLPGMPNLPSLDEVMAKVDALRERLASAVEDAREAIQEQIDKAMAEVEELKAKLANLPSVDDAVAKLKAMILDKAGNFDIMAFMAKLTFPGLPALPHIPLPMMFSFKMPDIEFNLSLTLLINHLTTGFIKPILDFVLKVVSKVVSFAIPKLCVNIPVPAMPELPAIKIPTVVLPPAGI